MKVYIVGVQGAEEHMNYNVYSNYDEAYKEWNALRLDMIEHWKRYLKDKESCIKELAIRCLEKLKETDPKKLDNFPHEEPFIETYEVLETYKEDD